MSGEAGTGPATGEMRGGELRGGEPPGGARPVHAAAIAPDPDLETVLIVRPIRDDEGRVVDGRIEFANDAWRQTFVPDGSDPTGRRMFEVGPPANAHDPRLTSFVDAVEHGTVTRFTLPHPLRPELVGELRVVPLGDTVLFVSNDATATERAWLLLADSERRYRELVDQVFDGVVVLGPDGGVRTMNRRVAEILGVGEGEIARMLGMQQEATVLATPEERAEARRRLAAGEVITGDAAVRRADGTEIVVEQRARRDPDGSTVLMVRDVTALRAAEEAHHERLMGEARNEALSRLAGGIAHDLNNHLTSILGYADLALADQDAPEQLANDLRQIVAASERAQEVTRRFLAFGRRALLRPRAVDLADALASIEPVLRHVAGNRLALIVGPGAGVPPVLVDVAMLERALVALVENARDAMGGRGVLGITTSIGGPEAPAGGPWARIRIEDTGVGMAPAELARAFEPFHDGDGGGLGLPMVQGFADQSGGHVRIESTPGEGTVVSLYLPLATAADPSAPDASAAAGPAGAARRRDEATGGTRSTTVLVVDDEQLIREVAERVLAREGYTILAAGSGEEALRVVSDETIAIDLLFTDVVMPGMNGVTLANVVRRQRPGIRVLITSGYSHAEIDREGAGGDSRFLPKPYSPQDLVDAVARALAVAGDTPTG